MARLTLSSPEPGKETSDMSSEAQKEADRINKQVPAKDSRAREKQLEDNIARLKKAQATDAAKKGTPVVINKTKGRVYTQAMPPPSRPGLDGEVDARYGDKYDRWQHLSDEWNSNKSALEKAEGIGHALTYTVPDAEAKREAMMSAIDAENAKWATVDAVRSSPLAALMVIGGEIAGANKETIDKLAQTGQVVGGIFGSAVATPGNILPTRRTGATVARKRNKTRTPSDKNKNIDHSRTTKNPDGSTTYYDHEGRPVTYKNGYADFSPYSEVDVQVTGLKGSIPPDDRLANQAAGLSRTPENYTWHHVEGGTRMQLVPTDIHSTFPHTGGASEIRNAGK